MDIKKLATDIAKGSRINVNIELVDGELVFDEWLTIRTEERETCRKTIAKSVKTMETRYILEVTKVVSNYPHEPDDVDIEEISDHGSLEGAIKNALLAIVANEIDHTIENISMETFLEGEHE